MDLEQFENWVTDRVLATLVARGRQWVTNLVTTLGLGPTA